MSPISPDDPSRPEIPRPLQVAAVLTGLEGLVSLGLGVADLFALHSGRIALGLTGVVFFVAYGGALVLFAVGMVRRQPWARSPVVLSQLITLGLAWNFRHDAPALSAAGTVAAVVVLVGVLHPASMTALNRPEHNVRD